MRVDNPDSVFPVGLFENAELFAYFDEGCYRTVKLLACVSG